VESCFITKDPETIEDGFDYVARECIILIASGRPKKTVLTFARKGACKRAERVGRKKFQVILALLQFRKQ